MRSWAVAGIIFVLVWVAGKQDSSRWGRHSRLLYGAGRVAHNLAGWDSGRRLREERTVSVRSTEAETCLVFKVGRGRRFARKAAMGLCRSGANQGGVIVES
jgi:hypothetical protein